MAYTTINKPSLYFDTSLWSGTGATQSISSLNFQPDWLWVKSRSTASNHRSQNSVTGVTKGLNPNETVAETTLTDCVTSFNSNGFTLGVDSQGYVNTSPRTYVGWSWLANGTGVSNTAGTITSTVSANTTAGFSIISYTGNGTADATVGHGLGVTPAFFVVKNRQDGTTNWNCYHQSLGKNLVMQLSTTSGQISVSNYWGTTGPTSTTIQFTNDANINANGQTLICYAFSEIKGYSKFGSYTGNGNADGTFVYTGFKPALVLQKTTSTTSDWNIVDNKRSTYNVNNLRLNPNTSSAESTSPDYCDLLSNGFKFRASSSGINGSGETNIYVAFAENPFVSSTFIPTTAR